VIVTEAAPVPTNFQILFLLHSAITDIVTEAAEVARDFQILLFPQAVVERVTEAPPACGVEAISASY
jgi:hypothetical protein